MLIKSCGRGVKAGQVTGWWRVAGGVWWDARVVGCACDLQVAYVELVDRVECSGANQRQPPQGVHAWEKIFDLASEM
jgi:hypothetical protein